MDPVGLINKKELKSSGKKASFGETGTLRQP
jgi:hypothetical protein